MNHSDCLVQLTDLTFGYGERVILDGITLSVPRGKVTALMGASGGGKTTVLRLIGGQYRAQQGSLTFDGREVAQLDGLQHVCDTVAVRYGGLRIAKGISQAAQRQIGREQEIGRDGADPRQQFERVKPVARGEAFDRAAGGAHAR